MIRCLIFFLCAMGLAFGPVATSGAIAAPGTMPGCTMGEHMPAKPADRSKMDCCTPACPISAAAALLPDRPASAAPLDRNAVGRERTTLNELPSFSPSGLDPPPRTLFS